MLKKHYKEQRDHLAAHLKNTTSKVYSITDGILRICREARRGRIGKGTAFKKIEKMANELKYWNDTPATMSYSFSPLGEMDSETGWDREKKTKGKLVLTQGHADNEIYPTIEDIKKIMAE